MIDLYILTYDNPNALNGAAKFVKKFLDNSGEFSQRGVNVKVCSNNLSYEDETEYVKTKSHKIKKAIKDKLKKTALGEYLFYLIMFRHNGQPAIDKFEKEKPSEDSVVLLNDMAVAERFFKKYGTKYKTIFMMHNSGRMLEGFGKISSKWPFNKWMKKKIDFVLGKATKYVCVSMSGVEYMKEDYPQYQDRPLCISIGQDSFEEIKTKYETDILKLVTVGTVNKNKNQLALIKALEKISRDDIQLTIVGGGSEYYEECNRYVESAGLVEKVKMVGGQTNVKPYLLEANTFIMASLYEGLPISAQEAMNMGLPLILTNVGGCEELIDGNGILVRSCDVDAIASAILQIADDKSSLEMMGAKSRKIFEERYTTEIMISKYVSLIKDLHN